MYLDLLAIASIWNKWKFERVNQVVVSYYLQQQQEDDIGEEEFNTG